MKEITQRTKRYDEVLMNPAEMISHRKVMTP